MALPPRGHPDRPLRLAARSMMVLGVLLLILATCGGIGVILSIAGGGPMAASASILALLFWMAPAIGFIVCSVNLKRYRAWAAIVGIVLAGMGLLASLLMLVGALLLAGPAAEDGLVWLLLLLLIPLLFVAAFAQLIAHLSRSFKAIRIYEMEGPQGHGFVPLLAEPVGPPLRSQPEG